VRLLVDTGVFSASLSRRRRARFETHVGLMAGHQVFLAAVTVTELRYGALVAGWGDPRRERLEASIRATTVVPVSDALLTTVAELRHGCRRLGHPLHERAHANDLWDRRFSDPHRRAATYRRHGIRQHPGSLAPSLVAASHQPTLTKPGSSARWPRLVNFENRQGAPSSSVSTIRLERSQRSRRTAERGQ
jgi:tRNA(fMet)-specific endonuclease VapC